MTTRRFEPRQLSRRELLFLGSAAAATTSLKLWAAQPAATLAASSGLERSLAAAAGFLWSQQADDGGWHSRQYGVLRSGQALTPFVLDALLAVPPAVAPERRNDVRRALTFIRKHVDADGALGRSDPEVLEYPVYSTAYAVRCLLSASADEGFRDAGDDALIERMCVYLMQAQFDVDAGFTSESPAFGGWGFDVARGQGDPGHMDLAHTRRALEALQAARPRLNPMDCSHSFKQAQQFLKVVQRHPEAIAPQPAAGIDVDDETIPPPFDGGFYFSPVVVDANKGRASDDPTPHWRSYATATCDGLLALLAAGVMRDDERVTGAVDWLRRHANLDYPQGVPTEHPEPWGAAIRYYHYAVRAEVYRALDFPAEERAKLAALVRREQQPDGRFVNDDSPLMKEDDPILCTALATIAMTDCLPAPERAIELR